MSALDDVKERLDIVAVVSEYLRLDKAGANFRALCPFHPEKTPSFFVFPDRQSWRCFGCGAGGDAFSFVMKKEGLGFGDTLRLLASKAGVTLAPRRRGPEEQWERLYQVNEAAVKLYHSLLLSSPGARMARDYAAKRGLSPEIIEEFRLGYAPDAWDGAKEHLMGQGYREQELVSAGLLSEKEERSYDRFRHRLMFPIRDAQGRAVGFGARALAEESEPKYLNSPQTPIFDKGSVLYALDRAREAIREQKVAVVVEGYMDALAAHQFGIRNVVASMGTALTEKQVGMLKGLAQTIALALDPDAAGDAATLRGIDICRRTLEREKRALPTWLGATSVLRTELRILPLPSGKDPDALIRESPEGWGPLVAGALPFVDHIFSLVASGSVDYRQLLPLIAEAGDEAQRELYLQRLARLVGVSERALAAMAARLHPTPRERAPRAAEASSARPPGNRLEEHCLCLLLRYPDLRHQTQALLPDHFTHAENREVFLAWQRATLEEGLDPSLRDHLEALKSRPLPPMEVNEQEAALDDCLRRLEERRLRAEDEALTAEAAFSDSGEEKQLSAQQKEELSKRAEDIHAKRLLTELGRRRRSEGIHLHQGNKE